MKIEKLKDQCTGCTACMARCPQNCISMHLDDEGFYFPEINKSKCIECGLCEKICHCLSPLEKMTKHISFYGASKNKDVLQSSSSGGAFYHLAELILKRGGTVFGAAFDFSDYVLKHISTDSVPIQAIQKSKYIESSMGNVIFEIQTLIDEGKDILFCGTPCQVSGVKKAIKDQKGHLLTCDFVCHGVPSSVLFREHLETLCRHEDKKLISLDFRPKDLPWDNKNIRLRIRTRTRTHTYPYYMDSFYYGFMTHNAFLRRSCYNCRFRNNHVADITIADFWGWKKFNPELDKDNGLSLIVANTESGKSAVLKMECFDLNSLDNKYSDYIYANKDYSKSWELRDRFYKNYFKYGFERAAKMTYLKDWKIRTIKYYIKKMLRKEV